MNFNIITIFPEMFTALASGITGRAQKKDLISVKCWDLREFSDSKHRRVDERPYGGGPGMVMTYAPLKKAITAVKQANSTPARVIHLSPQGKSVQQEMLQNLVTDNEVKNLIFLSGRYEGIDERLIAEEVDEEWSIGDYIISGGELAAMVVIDAITRLLPGALGDPESSQQDSFSSAGLLDYPHYTRPEDINNLAVPEILLSGDHASIARWRLKQSLGRTWLRRPDLLAQKNLTNEEERILEEFIAEIN
ncbi:MAG: tRNA (guanosine(37)-N1)-methyltransferase TrmD [Gammaproteobacteria bacterium GWE2_37_16]|nr:MAG: tRNA (guanosine(37)-N1)-methyltransferase TrmD [Gammaproteobacteria bacterium GWE2_37_16]